MSLQKNNYIDKISVVILCAGEGIRIKELTKDIPKPLIKIKALNNITILHDTINKLVKLGIKNIMIVKGHLGHKIDEFVKSLISDNSELEGIIKIIDTGTRYKLGPLYSFLSITKSDLYDENIPVYLVIPGDTIFAKNLLISILNILIDNILSIEHHPFAFYEDVHVDDLKDQFKEKKSVMISVSDIEKRKDNHLLKNIIQKKLEALHDSEQVRYTIPVFAFSRKILKDIIELEEKMPITSIKELINLFIKRGKDIYAMRVLHEYKFFDIDDKLDILRLNSTKNE